MCPSKLHDLVTHNPVIAQELLIYLTNTKEISKYYDELNQMKLSIALLEVFNCVQSHVDFPTEFTLLFVKNCMEQCSNSATGSKSVHKNRQVRIVIVFLQSILKQRVVEFEQISSSIRSFCLEHAQSKEANEFLREIIQMGALPKETNPGPSK